MSKIVITPEQIQQWKEQHKSVYKITLETGEVCYVRAPKLKEIEYASMNIAQGKMMRFGIVLFKSCFLGGDDVTNDDMKLMSAGSKMQETIEAVTSEVEKL